MDKKGKLDEINARIAKLDEKNSKKLEIIEGYEEKKKSKALTQAERIDRLEKIEGLQ